MTALPSPWRRIVDSRGVPLALFAVFTLLVFFTIKRFSVWIDESATLLLVGPHGYSEIVHYVTLDAHPPLWYLVLKPWLQLFGSTVIVSRAQSALFMIAAFAVWYYFVKTRFSRPLALVALALMVTNPMLLHYAVEGRMYAFALLLTALSCVVLTSDSPRRWFVYWPIAVAMLYTHYFLAFILAGQFVYLLRHRREYARSVGWIVVYGASIIAAFLPWLPNAFHMTHAVVTHGFWIPPVTPHTVPDYVLGTFLHRLDGELEGVRVFPAVVFVAMFAYALVRARAAKGGPVALLWAIAALPPLLLFVLSCKPFVPVFHPRYIIFGLPALITLLAAGALTLAGWRRAAVIAVLVLGSLAGIQMLRWKGFNDVRGFYSMNQLARDIAKPVDGELPTIVSAWLFPFFDARVTLKPEQRIVQLRDTPPVATEFPDVLYFDKPDWYVTSLTDVHARHVWLLEEALAPKKDVPTTWTLETTHVRGYVRARLFTVTDASPTARGPTPTPSP